MTGATQAPMTVLVVDDDQMQRVVLERALAVSGYKVVTAGSAEHRL